MEQAETKNIYSFRAMRMVNRTMYIGYMTASPLELQGEDITLKSWDDPDEPRTLLLFVHTQGIQSESRKHGFECDGSGNKQNGRYIHGASGNIREEILVPLGTPSP
jgi:hypothetical protein